MAEFYNITEWNIKRWMATGGTRAKCFVENPNNSKEYFFKESLDRYPSEFWSEIIASKVGKHLGFNLLDYNIGVLHDTPGCICESMIDRSIEELDHGINLIKESVRGFKVSDRPLILFKDVETSFRNYKGFIDKFINMLVFDAIIGNQDRHSENWAIIRSLDVSNESFNRKKVIQKMIGIYKSFGLSLKNVPFKTFFLQYMNKAELLNIAFSPIYDSGSSLGREIEEFKIQDFLNNKSKSIKYINKGTSEIKWEPNKSKINHFELLKRIHTKYPNQIKNNISSVIEKYKKEEIVQIINQIDNKIPFNLAETKLSLQRKKLMINFIDLRIEKLRSILSEV